MLRLVPHIHRIDTMAASARASLIGEITALDADVFHEPTPLQVQQAYQGVGVDECWMMAVRHRGRLIGYNAIRVWYEEGPNGRYALWRSRAAVLRPYRRASITGYFPVVLYSIFRARHPSMRLFTVNTLIHPSSFRLFATRVRSLYPFPNRELSAAHRVVYERAFERYGLERIPGGPDFLVRDPTVADSDPDEVAYWAASTAPCVQFFLEHIPNYHRGRAIVAINAVDASVILGISTRQLQRAFHKGVERVFGRPGTPPRPAIGTGSTGWLVLDEAPRGQEAP